MKVWLKPYKEMPNCDANGWICLDDYLLHYEKMERTTMSAKDLASQMRVIAEQGRMEVRFNVGYAVS